MKTRSFEVTIQAKWFGDSFDTLCESEINSWILRKFEGSVADIAVLAIKETKDTDMTLRSYDNYKLEAPDNEPDERRECDNCNRMFDYDDSNNYHMAGSCSAKCFLYSSLEDLRSVEGVDKALLQQMSYAVQELEDNQKEK